MGLGGDCEVGSGCRCMISSVACSRRASNEIAHANVELVMVYMVVQKHPLLLEQCTQPVEPPLDQPSSRSSCAQVLTAVGSRAGAWSKARCFWQGAARMLGSRERQAARGAFSGGQCVERPARQSQVLPRCKSRSLPLAHKRPLHRLWQRMLAPCMKPWCQQPSPPT